MKTPDQCCVQKYTQLLSISYPPPPAADGNLVMCSPQVEPSLRDIKDLCDIRRDFPLNLEDVLSSHLLFR